MVGYKMLHDSMSHQQLKNTILQKEFACPTWPTNRYGNVPITLYSITNIIIIYCIAFWPDMKRRYGQALKNRPQSVWTHEDMTGNATLSWRVLSSFTGMRWSSSRHHLAPLLTSQFMLNLNAILMQPYHLQFNQWQTCEGPNGTYLVTNWDDSVFKRVDQLRLHQSFKLSALEKTKFSFLSSSSVVTCLWLMTNMDSIEYVTQWSCIFISS